MLKSLIAMVGLGVLLAARSITLSLANASGAGASFLGRLNTDYPVLNIAPSLAPLICFVMRLIVALYSAHRASSEAFIMSDYTHRQMRLSISKMFSVMAPVRAVVVATGVCNMIAYIALVYALLYVNFSMVTLLLTTQIIIAPLISHIMRSHLLTCMQGMLLFVSLVEVIAIFASVYTIDPEGSLVMGVLMCLTSALF